MASPHINMPRPARRHLQARCCCCHCRRGTNRAPWPPGVHARSRPPSRLVVRHRHAVICPDIHRGPLFRCLVSRVTRARNHIGRHSITWPPPISGRDGRPRSDHNGVGNVGCMTSLRLGQLNMIQSNAIPLHNEHEHDFMVSSARSASRHWLSGWHIGYQLERYRTCTALNW